MDYTYWGRFLSPEEFKNWELEVLMCEAFLRYNGDFLEREFDNWKELISGSFTWRNTNQGSQYWIDIFRRDHY